MMPVTVQAFVLKVDGDGPDWPKAEMRKREWLTFDDARQRVDEDGLRRIFDRFIEHLWLSPAALAQSRWDWRAAEGWTTPFGHGLKTTHAVPCQLNCRCVGR